MIYFDLRRYLPLLLFIGLACGQVANDTSNIDYYKEGMIAAKQDFIDSKRLYGLIWNQSLLNPMINHYTRVTNPQHGKKFESGYRKEIRKQKLKQSFKIAWRITNMIPCVFLVIFLSNPGAGILLH
tara:strand:+ start:236 stop:613 length:378 start_codon:yes stop_codon:yes gene_type:complete